MSNTLDITVSPAFTPHLLEWYEQNARVLPWRNNPNPYHVWLSEIMLQQTRVVAVLDYYRRFLEELPTIAHLATCPEEKLMKLWQGLGYYNRARNLQKAAIQIMEQFDGVFPSTYEHILSLSGIGEYTAGAIASSVFELPHPAVDGNVLRVVARYTGNSGDITTSSMKKYVTQWVMTHLPEKEVRPYNQGLMELGATVCLPNGAPSCGICPVVDTCYCGGNESWKTLPVKKKSKPRKIEQRDVFLIYVDNKIVITQRPSRGLLANLWEFPHDLSELQPWKQWELPHTPSSFGTGIHIFSHIEWRMTGYAMYYTQCPPNFPNHWKLVTQEELQEVYAVPSAFSWLEKEIRFFS